MQAFKPSFEQVALEILRRVAICGRAYDLPAETELLLHPGNQPGLFEVIRQRGLPALDEAALDAFADKLFVDWIDVLNNMAPYLEAMAAEGHLFAMIKHNLIDK